ncbi:hemerythrin domain-containing protein [Nocardia suismassiliense]|uniref:Hemerythrin domain-containing protein n=1 Tax=Nocardia suismassiliense TaxID=2077092 RepID=A0ABW6R3T9_9NOCA
MFMHNNDMDALAFLRADHESLLAMLESLERGRGEGEAGFHARGDMATSLVMAASQHEVVEEQFFWPAVRRTLPDGNELADQAIAQEEAAKELLQQIEKSAVGSAEFEEALTEFSASARLHIEFEQGQVWPRFAAAERTESLKALGQKMANARKLAPTRPHPETPARPGVLKTAGVVVAAIDKLRDLTSGRQSKQPPPPS